MNDGFAMQLTNRGLFVTNEGALSVPGAAGNLVLQVLTEIGEMTDLNPVTVLAGAKNIQRER